MKKRIFSLILILGFLLPSAGLAEPFESKQGTARFASLPILSEALPRISMPQSGASWQPEKIQDRGAYVDVQKLQKEWMQGIYAWLCYQQNELTGLVESFEGSSDPFLKDQAATYDQALAGLAFLLMGDLERTKKILDFYQSKWQGKGFYNFYSTLNGRVGIEWRRHVGPNMWLAILIYQYTHHTKDETYLPLAEGLCDWVLSIPHYNGGVAMSDLDEPHVPWREIVSTENVIDVVAVFQMAVKRIEDFRKQQWYSEELRQAKLFLKNFVMAPNGEVARGYRPFLDGVDHVPALDTTTWLIATALPENIYADYGISVNTLIHYAEKTFKINLPKGIGFDYTSEQEAIKAKRKRISSLEWSGEMAQVYWLMAQSADLFSEPKEKYEEKLNQTLKGIDFYMQRKEGRISYPYANVSHEKTFSDGWYTPRAKKTGEASGSVAATCWRLFANQWNPLRLGSLPQTENLKVKSKPYTELNEKQKQQARELPSSLTSEGLTTAAWLNLRAGNKKEAKKYALKCIHMYAKQAQEQQIDKAGRGGLVLSKIVNEKTKQRIFRYPALNDVAACWVILSKTEPSLKGQASQAVRSKYSLAQVWDSRGFFWIAADAFSKN